MTIRYYTRQPMGEPSTHVFFSVVLWIVCISLVSRDIKTLLPQVKNTKSPGIGPSLRGRSSSSSRTSKPKMEALELSDGRHFFVTKNFAKNCEDRKKWGSSERSFGFFKHFIWENDPQRPRCGPGHNLAVLQRHGLSVDVKISVVGMIWDDQWDDPRLDVSDMC